MNVFDLKAKITMDTAEYVKNLTGASEKTASFGDRLKSGLATAGKIGAAAVGAVTVAAAAMTGAIVKNTGEVAEYGDNIDKMSQKMGMSAEAYQEWDAIMQHSGTSIESLQAGMKTLANAVENGNGAFERLGITQEEIAGMSNEDLFAATITALQNVENETERTYLAGQLLGRGATELGALLNTSAEDTEAMRQRVHELGGVMSNEAVKAAAAYQDSLQDMTTAFSGLKRGMISEFLPSLTTVMDGLTELFSGNSEGGLGQIKEGIGGMVDQFSETIPQILEVGSQLVVSLASAITDNFPTLIKAGADAVLTIGKGLIEELPALIGAGLDIIVAIADGVADALPELIPTIVDVVMQIVDKLTDPDTLSAFIEAGIAINLAIATGIIDAIPKLIEKIPQIITNLVTTIVDNVPKIAEAGITLFVALVKETPKIIGGIVKAIPEIIGGILGALGPLGGQLAEVFTGAWNGIKGVFSGVGSWFSDKFSGAREAAANAWVGIKNRFATSWEDTKKVFSGVGKWASDTFSNAKEKASGAWAGLKDRLSGSWENAKGAFSSVGDWVGGKFSGAKDAAIQAFGGLKDGLSTHWETAKTAFSSISSFFTTTFIRAKEAAAAAFAGIRDRMSESWSGIKAVFASAGGWFSGKFAEAKEAAGAAFSGIKALMGASWDGIKMIYSAAGSWFSSTFGKAKELASSAFVGIKDLMASHWEGIKGAFAAVGSWFQATFNSAKEMASTAFSGIRSLMASHWEGVKGVFSGIGAWFQSKFSEAKNRAVSAWSDIRSRFAEIKERIKSGLNIGEALTWGKDLMQNFIGGIMAKWDALKKTMSNIAGSIRDFIGFSEPKKGPLSNFHTFAPDMIDLFIQGLKDNTKRLLEQVAKTFNFRSVISEQVGKASDIATRSIKDLNASWDNYTRVSSAETQGMVDAIAKNIMSLKHAGEAVWDYTETSFGLTARDASLAVSEVARDLERSGQLVKKVLSGEISALDRFQILYDSLNTTAAWDAHFSGVFGDALSVVGVNSSDLLEMLQNAVSKVDFAQQFHDAYTYAGESLIEMGSVVWDELAEAAKSAAEAMNSDFVESQYSTEAWDQMATAALEASDAIRTAAEQNRALEPVVINVYPSAGMDEERLADLVDRKLAERYNRRVGVFA